MAVNTANIIIGPCTSFKTDNTDVGGTDSGVQVQKASTMVDLKVDQITAVVKKGLTADKYTVKTQLAESILTNLQLAWDVTAAPVYNGGLGTTTLSLGVEKTVNEHTLTFVGPAPGGKTRTYTVHRAVAMISGSALDIAKDKQHVIPVEFEILPDLTQPAGSEFGTIVDQ